MLFRSNNFSDVAPWSELLAKNAPGTLPPGIQLFLAQGGKDNLVLPRVTLGYVTKLCKAKSAVQLYSMPGVGHAFAGRDSATAAIDWIAGRFEGTAAPSNCDPN